MAVSGAKPVSYHRGRKLECSRACCRSQAQAERVLHQHSQQQASQLWNILHVGTPAQSAFQHVLSYIQAAPAHGNWPMFPGPERMVRNNRKSFKAAEKQSLGSLIYMGHLRICQKRIDAMLRKRLHAQAGGCHNRQP